MSVAGARLDHLWLDPTFGVSGDMILGALVSIGADATSVSAQLAGLHLPGVSLSFESAIRCGLSASRAVVTVPSQVERHRPWSTIDRMLAEASLPPTVSDGARTTFRRLGEIESRIHGVRIDEVRFHEVGADDAIADVVGGWLGWHSLGSPKISVGTFGLGHGTVASSHGALPLPAPAVAELLVGQTIRPLPVEAETVTPTGAAILTTMAGGFSAAPPAGRLIASGRGAGVRDPLDYPNVVTALLIDPHHRSEGATMVELSTNLDDLTSELVAHAVQSLLDAGAADAWITPIVMKKGRPAFSLNALCHPGDAQRLGAVMMAETATLGVRQSWVHRFVAPRRVESVVVQGHTIRMKVGPHGSKPEYDDVAAAARALGVPALEISRAASARWKAPS